MNNVTTLKRVNPSTQTQEPISSAASADREAQALVRLLGQHFGDRLVYLRRPEDGRLLRRATALGFVSEEGYLTATGCQCWRRAEESSSRIASCR